MGSTDMDMKTLLIVNVIFCFTFSIGLYLQIKIIKAIRREQAMAWEINMCHSIVMIVHFLCSISIETTTYIMPSLSRYTGMWFCYFASFIRGYGASAIIMHSLVVSIYKYIFIVHDEAVRKYGKDKTKKLLFWIILILPVFASVSFMWRPYLHIGEDSAINRCGLHQYPHINRTKALESIGDWLKLAFFCSIDDNDVKNGFDYFLDVSNQVYCFVQSVVGIVITANILEIFFYWKIFRYMKR